MLDFPLPDNTSDLRGHQASKHQEAGAARSAGSQRPLSRRELRSRWALSCPGGSPRGRGGTARSGESKGPGVRAHFLPRSLAVLICKVEGVVSASGSVG